MTKMSELTDKIVNARLVRGENFVFYRRKSPFPPGMGGTDGYGWFDGNIRERVDAAASYVECRMSEMAQKAGVDTKCPKCIRVADLYRLCMAAAIDQMMQEGSIVRFDRMVMNSRYWDVWMSMVGKCILSDGPYHNCPMGL